MYKDDLEFYYDISRYIEYDPLNGSLVWKDHYCNNTKSRLVGHQITYLMNKGYISLVFRGKRYLGHRIAWLLHYKVLPKKCIDHINGNRTDNSIINLREATVKENNRNVSAKKNNELGIKGIKNESGKYRARIFVDGKHINLGLFADLQNAINARREAEELHFGTFVRNA